MDTLFMRLLGRGETYIQTYTLFNLFDNFDSNPNDMSKASIFILLIFLIGSCKENKDTELEKKKLEAEESKYKWQTDSLAQANLKNKNEKQSKDSSAILGILTNYKSLFNGSFTYQELVLHLREIDISNAPNEFKQLFVNNIQQYEKLIDIKNAKKEFNDNKATDIVLEILNRWVKTSNSPLLDRASHGEKLNILEDEAGRGIKSSFYEIEKLSASYGIIFDNITTSNNEEVLEDDIGCGVVEYDCENLITGFLEAEDSRNFEKVKEYYANNINQYWHLSRPSFVELQKEYEANWFKKSYSKNKIISISNIFANTYLVTIDFSYTLRSGKSDMVRSEIQIEFDDECKIIFVNKYYPE